MHHEPLTIRCIPPIRLYLFRQMSRLIGTREPEPHMTLGVSVDMNVSCISQLHTASSQHKDLQIKDKNNT
ncbi:hypothetical protein Hanom_Chr06g00578251 [Helianthus anomalus]